MVGLELNQVIPGRNALAKEPVSSVTEMLSWDGERRRTVVPGVALSLRELMGVVLVRVIYFTVVISERCYARLRLSEV